MTVQQRLRAAAVTDAGRERTSNEDRYLCEPPTFAVADGMGGHRAGAVAAETALAVVAELAGSRTDDPRDWLARANVEVMRRGASDRALRGMATTCTLLVLDGSTGRIAHVGDSRAYLFRDGGLRQLTEDHTFVGKLVREGMLNADEAARHPRRSILMRGLGHRAEVEVDLVTLDVAPGDKVLLCTDGLTSMVDDETIGVVLGDGLEPQPTVERLRDLANRAGGDDNVTVVLVEVSAPERRAT
jgi:serine/threonine protein phosphatase PrpC